MLFQLDENTSKQEHCVNCWPRGSHLIHYFYRTGWLIRYTKLPDWSIVVVDSGVRCEPVIELKSFILLMNDCPPKIELFIFVQFALTHNRLLKCLLVLTQ